MNYLQARKHKRVQVRDSVLDVGIQYSIQFAHKVAYKGKFREESKILL